jgi:hypothetical protein
MDSYKAFMAVPKEKLTTIDNVEKQRILHKIKHQGLYQKPEKHMKISWYGITGPREDFAESYVNYVLNNRNLAKIEPERWAFMKKYVFNGIQYPDFTIKKAITNLKKAIKQHPSKFSVQSDSNETTLYPDSELDQPYIPLPGTENELENRKDLQKRLKELRIRL